MLYAKRQTRRKRKHKSLKTSASSTRYEKAGIHTYIYITIYTYFPKQGWPCYCGKSACRVLETTACVEPLEAAAQFAEVPAPTTLRLADDESI